MQTLQSFLFILIRVPSPMSYNPPLAIAWCRRVTSHYRSRYWSRSVSPYDATRPQWDWNWNYSSTCNYSNVSAVSVRCSGGLTNLMRNICVFLPDTVNDDSAVVFDMQFRLHLYTYACRVLHKITIFMKLGKINSVSNISSVKALHVNQTISCLWMLMIVLRWLITSLMLGLVYPLVSLYEFMTSGKERALHGFAFTLVT